MRRLMPLFCRLLTALPRLLRRCSITTNLYRDRVLRLKWRSAWRIAGYHA